MNTADQLKTIRKACVKAIPEIQGEHVFETGCNRCKYCDVARIIVDAKRFPVAVDEKSSGSTHEVEVTEHRQDGFPCPNLTRRPIRLADILYTYQYFSAGVTLGVNQAGYFMFSDSCVPAYGQYRYTLATHNIIALREAHGGGIWNIRKDSLEDQSEETISFIHSILI